MSRAAGAGHLVVVVAMTLLAVGCGSRPGPIANAEPTADSLDAEPPASAPADIQDAGSGAELTEAELTDLERTLDETDAVVDELEQDFDDD